tara:strand:+ start:615 stop:773 length:159 start_codon:yes stop_codon:yes gene_type:complete
MYRKKLIQKLQQLIDILPVSKKRKQAREDLLNLKVNLKESDLISLKNKYDKL